MATLTTAQPQSEVSLTDSAAAVVEGMIDVEAVARHFNVDPSTIRRLANDGQVPALRIGRQLRFVLVDVVEALAKRGPALSGRQVYTAAATGVNARA